MSVIKTKGLLDNDGEEFVFIPPEPEGDDLGGISATDVAQITTNKNNIETNASDVHELKSQNLLNPTLTTTTDHSVTCTANGDGTYTTSGTLTGTSSGALRMTLASMHLIKGKYKLVGCPSGGGYELFGIQIHEGTGTSTLLARDYGDGYDFDIDSDKDVTIRILFREGVNMNGKVFKPMITYNLDATYDDYKPYSESFVYGKEITSLNNALTKSRMKEITGLNGYRLFYDEEIVVLQISKGGINVVMQGESNLIDLPFRLIDRTNCYWPITIIDSGWQLKAFGFVAVNANMQTLMVRGSAVVSNAICLGQIIIPRHLTEL